MDNKKAALYVRVSTNYQIDKDSLPFQRKELQQYAEYVLGIKDTEIFEDAGYSGKNTDRPAYKRMMEKCRNGAFTHVLVWKIDRISRNLLDFAGMYEELKRCGVTFISKNEQFDTSSAMGEAMLKIILVFAELERKLTSERVTAIMMDRANKGLWNGARMPLGYRWSKETKYPEIDLEEAMTVKYIFDEYERTHSTTAISRKLNNQAIKTKRGGEWTTKTIADVLRSPFYIGTYRYNYRQSAKGKKKPEAEWIILENNHPGIIERDQWEKVNHIMDIHNVTKNTSEFKTKHIHIFSGVLKCGLCESNFNACKVDKARLNGWRPTTYICSRRAKSTHCNNKMASDVIVGPFIFNYISNILKARMNINEIGGINKLQKILLAGECFEDVKSIAADGLQALYNSLIYRTVPTVEYDPKTEDSSSLSPDIELGALHKEKEKNERALQRLKQLYLYDESGMTEQDYIKSKNEITAVLNTILIKINEVEKKASISASGADISFIQNASNFIVSKRLSSKKYIDYPELCLKLDNQVLKDFISTTIDWIYVTNSKVTKIIFKNGLIHEFNY